MVAMARSLLAVAASTGAAADPSQLPPGLFPTLLRRILLLLCVGYGFCLLARTNMSIAQLQMAGDLELSEASFGAAASAFFLSYTALQVPANYVITRVGPTRALAAYVICWGLVSAAHGLVSSSRQLVVLRVLLGVAESGYYPGCIYYMTRWFPKQVSAQVIALFLSGSVVLTSLMTGTSGLLMDSLDGVAGMRGWRWLFILQGLPCVPLGLCFLLLLDETPKPVAWLQPHERMWLADNCSEAQGQSKSELSLVESLRRLLSLRSTWTLGLSWVSLTTSSYVGAFFFPVITKDILPEWSASAISAFTLLPTAIRLGFNPVIARWADHGSSRRKVVVAWGFPATNKLCMTLISVPLLVANLQGLAGTSAGLLYWVLASFVIVWIVESDGVLWALHHRHQPAELLPISIAVINTFGQLGGLLGPYLFGLLHDSSQACPAVTPSCPAEWGAPLVVLYGGTFALTTATGLAALALGFARDEPAVEPAPDLQKGRVSKGKGFLRRPSMRLF